MYITLSVVGIDTVDLYHRAPKQFIEFDLEDLFENTIFEDEMVTRAETRVRALARVLGVEVDYVQFESAEMHGHLLDGRSGDAIDLLADYVKLWNWASDKGEWDYLPIFARVAEDGFRYTDSGNFNRELENFFTSFDEYEYGELARTLVEDGLIEEPGESWEDYVDWDARGEAIASEYTEYTLDGVSYLFSE